MNTHLMKTATIIKKLKTAHSNRGELPAISKTTKIPMAWLYKVARGDIKAPQAERVDTLREYFQSQKKEAA